MGETFASIRRELTEVRCFQKKKMVPNPTYVYWKAIDLEEAWPACQETLHAAYSALASLSRSIDVQAPPFNLAAGFMAGLDQTLLLLNHVMLGMADALGTRSFTEKQLHAMDESILTVQTRSTHLRQFVITEFDFTTAKAHLTPFNGNIPSSEK